jgi:hypothetical protein
MDDVILSILLRLFIPKVSVKSRDRQMTACTQERIFDTKVIILHPNFFLSFEYVGFRINVPELLLQTSVLRLFPYPEPWTLLKLSVKVLFVYHRVKSMCGFVLVILIQNNRI